MRTSNRDISSYLFLLIAFCVIDDVLRVYRLLEFGYGFPPEWGYEWGIVLRILGPAALIFIGVWRFKVKPKNLSYCLFGISRLLSLNSMFIERKLTLGVPAMGVAFFADLVALYLSVVAFKQSKDRIGRFPVRRVLLKIVLVVGMAALIALIGRVFFRTNR
jgi:hypothetical protein